MTLAGGHRPLGVALACSALLGGRVAAAADSGGPGGAAGAAAGLAGTTWRLVRFQSPDDAVGTLSPDDPAKYEMRLGADGRLAMRLDRNRAAGRWEASAPGPGGGGSFAVGPLAMTRAACPEGSLDTRIARDAGFVRSYVIEGGTLLHLDLTADGGTSTWRRVEGG